MTRANPASIDPPGASDASSLRRARVTVRQLCSLRLPAPVLLPSLLPAARAVVRSSHAAFFYADAAGNMTNMYAERMLPPEAMARYYEQYYRADSSAFTKSYLSLVAASDPVSAEPSVQWNEAATTSATYCHRLMLDTSCTASYVRRGTAASRSVS